MKLKEFERQFVIINRTKPEVIMVLGMTKKQSIEVQKFIQKLSENIYEYDDREFQFGTDENSPIYLIATRNPTPR